jgi:prevent-host-death family protein
MRHVPIAEFKDHLSELVAAAEAGEEVIITRHGKAAVRLVPMRDEQALRMKRQEAWDRLAHLREQMRAAGQTATLEEIIDWKNEGRR